MKSEKRFKGCLLDQINYIFISWVGIIFIKNILPMSLFSKDFKLPKKQYFSYNLFMVVVIGINIFFFPGQLHTFILSLIAYIIFIALTAGRLRQLNDDPKYGTTFLAILYLVFISMFGTYKLYIDDFKLFMIVGSIPLVFINVVFWHCVFTKRISLKNQS